MKANQMYLHQSDFLVIGAVLITGLILFVLYRRVLRGFLGRIPEGFVSLGQVSGAGLSASLRLLKEAGIKAVAIDRAPASRKRHSSLMHIQESSGTFEIFVHATDLDRAKSVIARNKNA